MKMDIIYKNKETVQKPIAHTYWPVSRRFGVSSSEYPLPAQQPCQSSPQPFPMVPTEAGKLFEVQPCIQNAFSAITCHCLLFPQR